MASINNLNVLGNVSGSAAAPTSVEIKDEDAMTSDSATALATQQSIKAYVDSNAGIPTGTVTAFAGSTAPTGYALCDRSAVNRTTQAALFAVIGTTYGSGDGSTTFNLPDLRGRVVAGLGESLLGATADSLGDDNGLIADTKEHTLTEAEMPSHSHTYVKHTSLGASGSGGNAQLGTTSQSTSSVGDGEAHNNVQPTIILNYIIKT